MNRIIQYLLVAGIGLSAISHAHSATPVRGLGFKGIGKHVKKRRARKKRLAQLKIEDAKNNRLERIAVGAGSVAALAASISLYELGYNPLLVKSAFLTTATMAATAAVPKGIPGWRAVLSGGVAGVSLTYVGGKLLEQAADNFVHQVFTLGGLIPWM